MGISTEYKNFKRIRSMKTICIYHSRDLDDWISAAGFVVDDLYSILKNE